MRKKLENGEKIKRVNYRGCRVVGVVGEKINYSKLYELYKLYK